MKALSLSLLCCLPCLDAQEEPEAQAGGIRLVGRVVDWQGTPIAGAAVGMGTRDEVVTATVLADPVTLTDEQGRFRLEYPRPEEGATGNPYVHVVKIGWASILQYPRLQKDGDDYHAETDMGDLVLAEGARMFGRVRDEAGNPVAGARVTATDALSHARGLSGMSTAHCVALTDRSGIFSLPCALPQAARIQIEAEGWFDAFVSPVGRQTPLEVTLKRGGIVFGRVLDPRGSGVETTVYVRHERSLGNETLRTGADGSFRFTLGQPGRYRLRANAPRDSKLKTTQSPLLEGPRANLEIVMEAVDAADAGTRLVVRCVDRETAKEVTEFRAVSMWEDYANQNANYREYRLAYYIDRNAVKAEAGVALLPGPGENQPGLGCVRVVAPGRAPATVTEFEWKVPEDGEDKDLELTVELVPESVVLGKVVDERTGAPIAGAKVWARPKQDPQLGTYSSGNNVPDDAAVSGEEGSFRLGQLGEGGWELCVRHPERPDIPAVDVELEASQHKEWNVRLPEGAVVKGSLVGAVAGKGWKVYLQPLPSFAGGNQYSGSRVYYGPDHVPEDAVDVAEDGSFRFQGVKLANFMLMLLQPSPPRLGSPLRVEVEPFRVRRQGIDRKFDLSEDQPGVLRGKLELEGADVPMDRLVVVARQKIENQHVFFSPFSIQYQGPRSFVKPSGEFAIEVTPGNYLLEVVDVATSIRLHATSEAVEVKASGAEETVVPLELVELTVKLATPADSEVTLDRVEVRSSPANVKNPNVAVMMGGNDNYDTGAGLTLDPGQTEFKVVVPPGEALFLVRNNTAALADEVNRGNQAPLGRGEVTVEAGKPQTVEVRVEPPPETAQRDGADAAQVDKGRW